MNIFFYDIVNNCKKRVLNKIIYILFIINKLDNESNFIFGVLLRNLIIKVLKNIDWFRIL